MGNKDDIRAPRYTLTGFEIRVRGPLKTFGLLHFRRFSYVLISKKYKIKATDSPLKILISKPESPEFTRCYR